MFTPTTRPIIYPIIPDNAPFIFRSRAKSVHKSLWRDFNMHKAAKHGCHAFIIDNVKDTWIRKLRHDETIYVNITTKALMVHLKLRYGGLHALNFFELTSKMLTY